LKPSSTMAQWSLVLCLSVFMSSCSDKGVNAPPHEIGGGSGYQRVFVDVTPDSIAAPWTLSGLGTSFVVRGRGDMTVDVPDENVPILVET